MQSIAVSSVPLKSGDWVSLGAVEIVSIPHQSIINSTGKTETDLLAMYRAEFGKMLDEVFQGFKASGYSQEIALELLWKTEPVVNQPYKASIRIYLIVRGIGRTRTSAEEPADQMLRMLLSALSFLKYDVRIVEADKHATLMADIEDNSIRAIVKEESAENLQNMMLTYCYSYSRLPVSDNDLSRIADVLTGCPNAAVSFQLIPTVFSQSESAEIDRTAQSLDTLSRGVMEQGVGTISFALAERHAEDYRYYASHKGSALFLYNVLIYGSEPACKAITSRVYAELASGKDRNANLKIVFLSNSEVRKNRNFYPLPWAVNGLLSRRDRNAELWSSQLFSPALQRLPYVITGEEASAFFRLPLGSDHISAGFHINESERDSKTYASDIINSGDIVIGRLKASPNEATIGFALRDLAKHMLIVGTPGSGKTTFSVSLLDRLWKEHGIPFLVIEPAKNEYRALIKSIPELQVFTPGKNFISPFVYNPFVPPKNVKLEAYKSTLKTAFAAGVSMSTPLDKIFEETVNNCYSDFRWLDTYTSDEKGRTFNIADFIQCFQKTFDEIGYTGDARNIGRAGVVRLKSLVNLFDNYYSIPIEDLLQKPTVIELAAIENSDQKALIIALLLLSVLAYVNANYTGEGGLKNVILLEEAHVLLDGGSQAEQGDSNPSAVAQGLIKRMLAEIRSYGVGIVIADQSPRKVTTDVVALTDMKVVFRLVENEDKQIIAGSTNMSDAQTRRLSKLRPGEAFLFFGKLDEPEEVIMPDYRLDNNISISLSDESILRLSRYWRDKEKALRPYPQCEKCPSCTESCDYARRILAREIARRIFNRYIKTGARDFDAVKAVFAHITRLTMAELNDEPFSVELLRCVKVHLWRRIRYETKLSVSDKLIENSIRK